MVVGGLDGSIGSIGSIGSMGSMGSVLVTGRGDHLPPLNTDPMSVFIQQTEPDTQADLPTQEVTVELLEEDQAVWESAVESGFVSDAPAEGKMLKVKINGQATVFVSHGGKVCVDNFSS